VVVGDEALGAFAGDFVDGVDEKDAAFALGRRPGFKVTNCDLKRRRYSASRGIETRSFAEQADYLLNAARQILPQFVNPESNHAPIDA